MSMVEKAPGVRRVCPVIFLLDASGSMDGQPIGAVNGAMEWVLPELKSMNDSNADNKIKVAVMKFETDTTWLTGNGLVDPKDFQWKDMNVGNLTAMGKAFTELEKALHITTGFMNEASGSTAPVLFLLSDGEPSDEYKMALKKLQDNNWYKIAARVAIGYSEFCNTTVLTEFTQNTETVLLEKDPINLKKLIEFTIVTSSQFVTGSGKSKVSSPRVGKNDNAAADSLDDNTAALAKDLAANPPQLADTDDVGGW